jgi:alcohol/geraniol dehydrogenase (NADP+)
LPGAIELGSRRRGNDSWFRQVTPRIQQEHAMARIRAWAAHDARKTLLPYEFDPGPLGDDEVEVAVAHCGVCHSDISVLNSEWGPSRYPVVAGHEAVGQVVALGKSAKALKEGDRVGVGWTASSCMQCRMCLSGSQHLCPSAAATIVGRCGGFAERVRAHWAWAVPLPEGLGMGSAGPLLCGGITVFNALALFGVKPTDRVGVVGIGGLGHMAIKFAAAWGCDVTAFTSSGGKTEEVLDFGAHRVVSSRDREAILMERGSIDFLLVTVNVPLDWDALMATLAPNGRMHVVGAVPEPIPVKAFDLIGGQRAVSGSPTGAPVHILAMLEFAARHGIAPQVEHFPMSWVNEALKHVEDGKARYRVVLDADFG